MYLVIKVEQDKQVRILGMVGTNNHLSLVLGNWYNSDVVPFKTTGVGEGHVTFGLPRNS